MNIYPVLTDNIYSKASLILYRQVVVKDRWKIIQNALSGRVSACGTKDLVTSCMQMKFSHIKHGITCMHIVLAKSVSNSGRIRHVVLKI